MKAAVSSGNLFCFGLGFTGSALARKAREEGWNIAGTCREQDRARQLTEAGIPAWPFDGRQGSVDIEKRLTQASHILIAIPPQKEEGEVALKYFKKVLTAGPPLRWLGYLSTTGVYGDRGGEWVDESSELKPELDHQRRRVEAERLWLDLFHESRVPVHIFRLGGIYGPGRNLLERVRQGTAKRIDQPGLVFNRIHVADVVQVLIASMDRPRPGAIYNVVDNRPAAPAEAVVFACQLLGLEPPPLISLEDAGLSPMGRGFYATNKRVSNRKIREELGIHLHYPDYEAGLRAILEEERNG